MFKEPIFKTSHLPFPIPSQLFNGIATEDIEHAFNFTIWWSVQKHANALKTEAPVSLETLKTVNSKRRWREKGRKLSTRGAAGTRNIENLQLEAPLEPEKPHAVISRRRWGQTTRKTDNKYVCDQLPHQKINFTMVFV